MKTKAVTPKGIVSTIKEVGIQAVSPIIRFLGRLINQVVTIDDDKDGSVEGSEILKAVQNVGFDAFAVFRGFDINEVKAELKDLDPDERQKLIDAFSQEFDLPNDQAEYLVEDWIEWLNRGTILVGRTRTFVKDKKVA